jgi:sortase A
VHRSPEERAAVLVELLRSKPWVRRALSGLSVLLLLGGVALVGYPFFTNVWQDRVQDRLTRQLATPQLEQAYRERRVGTGDSLTRVKIPRLGVDVVVVEGTTPSALRAGAGHYAETALPCEMGNFGVAGHRTTFGKPFANIDQLRPGDTIQVQTPVGGCEYRVSQDPWVVDPGEMTVLDPTPDKALTFTTCHPKGSAKERLIVRATWVKDVSRT